MDIICVDESNIERERRSWLKERFRDGLVFEKLNVRGKVFIEYIPAEHAGYPVTAEGYMFINCFWVSGQYKGFQECARQGRIDRKGAVLYYSNQCPHAEKYETEEQVQEAPPSFTTYSLFYDGRFITNELLSEKKFIKFPKEKGL